jgi:Putative 2OG-Fe(II) oxygenase
MIKHAIFPTLIIQDQYPNAYEFKPIFMNKLMKYMTIDGFSSEFTGHVNIHHEEAYAPLFVYISEMIAEYVRAIGIDPEIFDINIIKTWMNITKERHTPFHNHEDAQLSFTYYANIPENLEKPLVFCNAPPHNNDPYYGMIKFNANETNRWNEYDHKFVPSEGDLFIFPSTLNHYTVGYGTEEPDTGCKHVSDLYTKRVCLAGDIIFTYRKNMPRPTGIQPTSNWRIFRNEIHNDL